MSYYAISGHHASLFVHGNRVESKHYVMQEVNGNTEAWERSSTCIKHIYTLDHTNKIIAFGPDFEQVYVWCIRGRFHSSPILFKIEPLTNS
jgi:hypothetical protein